MEEVWRRFAGFGGFERGGGATLGESRRISAAILGTMSQPSSSYWPLATPASMSGTGGYPSAPWYTLRESTCKGRRRYLHYLGSVSSYLGSISATSRPGSVSEVSRKCLRSVPEASLTSSEPEKFVMRCVRPQVCEPVTHHSTDVIR